MRKNKTVYTSANVEKFIHSFADTERKNRNQMGCLFFLVFGQLFLLLLIHFSFHNAII